MKAVKAVNPFDAADLTRLDEAVHILNWYARCTSVMRQRCVDTIVDDAAVITFLSIAAEHSEHSYDFDTDALRDLAERMRRKIGAT